MNTPAQVEAMVRKLATTRRKINEPTTVNITEQSLNPARQIEAKAREISSKWSNSHPVRT